MRELAILNPRKPAKRKGVTANPRKAHKAKKTHRNPRLLGGKIGGFVKPLVPAAIGGAGALASDLLLAKLPLPENIRTQISSGPMKALAKVGIALAMGYAARFVTNKQNADLITAGALTVVAYDQIRGFVQTQFPALGLSGLSAYQYASGFNALPTIRRISGNGSGVSAYVPSRGRSSDVGMIPVVK